MAAIFDFSFTPTSESIHNSLCVLLDPENMEDTVGILPLATIQDVHCLLHVIPVSHPPFWFPVQHSWISTQCELWAAAVTSTFSENSEATLCSLPYVKYASCFMGYQIYQFSTKKFIYLPPFPVSPFRNWLDYIWKLNVILSALSGSRNVLQRIQNSVGPLSYSRKSLGCSICTPRRSRVNIPRKY